MERTLGTNIRILALLTDGFGASGGIARYNQDLMHALSRSSAVKDVVILPRFGATGALRCQSASEAHALPRKINQLKPSPQRAAWCARAMALVSTQRFDAIFCGHLNSAFFAACIAAACSIPLWLQVHGIDAWSARGGQFRWALRNARLVTSVSRHTRAQVLAWSNVDPAQLRVLPNTFRATAPAVDLPAQISERFGLAGKRIILTVGRLASAERYKGHARIISALPEVLNACPDAAYLVAGAGDDLDFLREHAARVGVSNQVVFAGFIPDRDLPELFRCAHVLAMPSTGEGFGIVFLEAAAAGLPAIGGNRDGSVDALADGILGRLIDPTDQSQLVGSLIAGLQGTLVFDPSAVQRFAFDNFARHVDDLVSDALLARRPAPGLHQSLRP